MENKKQIRKQKLKTIHSAMRLLNVPPLPYKLNLKTMGFTIDLDSQKRYWDFLELR
jgi:hypothetical protein